MAKYIEEKAENAPLKKDIERRKKNKLLATKRTKKFIKTVKNFIKEKNGGSIPPEFECSLMLFEIYYNQFQQITLELDAMDSIIIEGKYGPQPTSLLGAQQTMALRIENYLKEYGMTLKTSLKMGLQEVKEPESAIEQWMNNQNVEVR